VNGARLDVDDEDERDCVEEDVDGPSEDTEEELIEDVDIELSDDSDDKELVDLLLERDCVELDTEEESDDRESKILLEENDELVGSASVLEEEKLCEIKLNDDDSLFTTTESVPFKISTVPLFA
jgi:hypothetical protein